MFTQDAITAADMFIEAILMYGTPIAGLITCIYAACMAEHNIRD